MTNWEAKCLFLCLILGYVGTPYAQSMDSTVKAFPEAEGFGAVATGGRGGQVVEVTNLNDSGVGSLRACVEASGPRTCVFRIGGNIVLKSKLAVRNPYITIAGQTAPGGGITLRTDPINSSGLLEIRDTAHDVVIRHIRIRPGPGSGAGDTLDAVTIMGSRVILDHVSASWGVDENVNSWYSTAHDITIQWSIVSEGLNNSTHTEGPHSKGMLLGSHDAHSITVHHNLLAHNDDRHPQVKTRTGGVVDVVNNVVYNWGQKAAYTDDSYGIPLVNFVGNCYKPGANSSLGMYEIHYRNAAARGTQLYVKGNIGPHRPNDSLPESEAVRPADRAYIVTTRHAAPAVTAQTAQEAFELVLAGAGASIALRCDGTGYLRRDPVDTRIVTDVRNGTGRIIDDPSQVGGWPALDPGAGCVDGDRDGMPDVWESAHGFNPGVVSDGVQDADGDGYTNFEEYLNITDPRGGPPPPPPSDITPPTISGVAAEGVTSSAADITWATDEPADRQVEYCLTSTKCGIVTTLDSTPETQHRVHLFSLQAATTYHYWVKSKDAAGNLSEAGPMNFTTASEPAPGGPLRVPQDFGTIQSAIDSAKDGDVVLVSPGAYRENLTLAGKSVTLASEFHTTQDGRLIDQTILDGAGAAVITVAASADAETKVIGFTIRNGADGISAAGKVHILNNRIIGNGDGIDYEGGGGACRNNVIEGNRDDGIDFDGAAGAAVEDNIIRNNGDDGIEVRLHEYSGATLDILVRNNVISSNGEDGIQLIDHPGASNRFLVIERNLIEGNAMAGLGMMDNGVTLEDYRAAGITDPVHLFNNTFRDNAYAVTGGDNVVALNNLFVGSPGIGIKGVDGESIAAHNLFWGNGTDVSSSNLDAVSTVFANPLLTADSQLQAGSPAIDAGTAFFQWKGQTVLNLPSDAYSGAAPDLGKLEYIGDPKPAPLSVTSIAPGSTRIGTSVNVTISGTGFEPGLQVSFAGGQGPTPTTSRVTVVNSTTVTVTVSVRAAGPKKIRYWDVIVVNPDDRKATLSRGFTVVP